MCICSTCSETYIKTALDNVLGFLNKYAWLMDSYILDFFVDRHWEALPSSWQHKLMNLPPEKLGEWVDYSRPYRDTGVWPLSLLALRAAASRLSISRQPEHCNNSSERLHLGDHCSHCQFVNLDVTEGEQDTKLYSRYIKPKKYHEINRMAKVASSCAERLSCCYIVDVGSGLGHLGRVLALRHGLRVCCLEEQTNLTDKARQLDQQMIKALYKKQQNLVPPIHVNTSIEAAIQFEEFVKVIQEAFEAQGEANFKFGIVGLHPCGDLGPTLLRLFVNCPAACFINLVGCCYMKITDDSSTKVNGYPLSSHTMQQPHRISYEAKEVACHAIETYCQRLRNGCVAELKVHCYRATLEKIIVKNWPDLRHSGLRSIKHVQDMEFQIYAKQAVGRLGLQLPLDELEDPETCTQLSQWLRVVAFYSLRLLLAPSVESAILLDRMLFLHEAGISNFLLPAFDPELSPRNHILVAMKDK